MLAFKSFFALALTLLWGCASTSGGSSTAALHESRPLALGAEARSLTGSLLYPPPLPGADLAVRQSALYEAIAAWERAPEDPDAMIWVGRRLGYLGRFREAIEVFTIGANQHPDDARFLRHRGHRRISVREFDAAAEDLQRAADLMRDRPDLPEPDGMPNSRGIPLETLKSNIFYHLALAHFLRGDFESALPVWRETLKVAANPDTRSSASNWLYLTLRRLERDAEAAEVIAAISADLDVVEYHAYHQLCLAYQGALDIDQLFDQARAKGLASTDFATIGFGVGHWYLTEGRVDRAREIFELVCTSPSWHAFGRIGAEVELARRH